MTEPIPEEPHIAPAEPPAFDPQRIMAAFAEAFDCLPEDEINEARQHRDVMVPLLIQAIRDATATIRAEEDLEGNAHLLSLFLLAEFGAREALPAVVEAISLPGEGPFDLFEDVITELLAPVLIGLTDDPLAVADDLIANPALNEFVRSQAVHVYCHALRAGRVTRQEAIERLRKHLRREMDANGIEIVSPLIRELCELAAVEAHNEIKEAFERDLVDKWVIDPQEVDGLMAGGEAGAQEYLRELPIFEDTIEELSRWSSFGAQDSDDEVGEPPALPLPDLPERPKPFIRETRKVGRNEPCPCGSGKKYKKCCGKTA